MHGAPYNELLQTKARAWAFIENQLGTLGYGLCTQDRGNRCRQSDNIYIKKKRGPGRWIRRAAVRVNPEDRRYFLKSNDYILHQRPGFSDSKHISFPEVAAPQCSVTLGRLFAMKQVAANRV